MSVKIQPTSVIKAELGINPNGPVQEFFTSTCYRYMDKYVPMSDTIHKGDLRSIVDIQSDRIVYQSPYASYQYYGERKDKTHKVKNYTTPGTGPYWDERMWSAQKDEVLKEVQDFIKRGGKK